MEHNFPKATALGKYFMPQSGATMSRSGGTTSNAARIRCASSAGSSISGSFKSRIPTNTVLSDNVARMDRSRRGWAASMEI